MRSLVLFALLAVALCFKATPTATPSFSNVTSATGFYTAVSLAPGPFYVDFALKNAVMGGNTSQYELQLFDLSEVTLNKNKPTYNNSIQLGQALAVTVSTKKVNGDMQYTTTFPAVAGRYTSLVLTTTVSEAANASSFETTVQLTGYKFVTAGSNLTMRYYISSNAKKCKVNTECNCSALFESGNVNRSGVIIQESYFYIGNTYTMGAATTLPAVFSYDNGALVVTFVNFTGGDLTHDPTTGLSGGADVPKSIFKTNLESTWWFGWSSTTWYIILAVVGVIVLLALVALIGAIIVWNRGKPGYEQV